MAKTSNGASPSGNSHRGWRFVPSWRRNQPPTFQTRTDTVPDTDNGDFATLRHTDSHPESGDAQGRQLLALVQRMRNAPSSASHVDAAYKEFQKIYSEAAILCSNILKEEIWVPYRTTSNTTQVRLTRRDSSLDSPRPFPPFDNRSSFSGRSLTEVPTGGKASTWLAPIRDWKSCIENLCDAFRVSLIDTYKSYERDATPERLDLLFANKRFRKEAVNRMRNASVTRVLSADPQFFPRYEIRFRNYDKAKEELAVVRQLLQCGESGISPNRIIQEFTTAANGDAVLEFANLHPECSADDAVLRFRVSSRVLAETSPLFARMFSGPSASLKVHETEDIVDQLPPPPTRYYCKDGTEAKLYRMPQRETNSFDAMRILMDAAHLRTSAVPRDVTFEQFVAIAECSLRYQSTSPLEAIVEHRWLPKWLHRGADEMPDGLLIISYAFGARGLFMRMSKSAVLNLVDEKDLHSKPWPKKIKDKIWAVRSVKLAQLLECCTSLLQEFLPPPTSESLLSTSAAASPSSGLGGLGSPAATPKPVFSLSNVPRCPKGSHWCDATNLGWLMLVFNNLSILSSILQSSSLPSQAVSAPPSRSLAQIVDLLKSVPSAMTPVHRGGVCDPIPSFRTAIADIYNTVSGLTLHDVSGKSHGWGLSKNLVSEPQEEELTGLMRMAAHDNNFTVASEFSESVLLRILSEIVDLEDLHSAAQINRSFYDTYKLYELPLMKKFLRSGLARNGAGNHQSSVIPIVSTNAEDKSRYTDKEMLKDRRARILGAHVDEDDDDSESDSGDWSDGVDDEMPEMSGISTPRSNGQEPPGYDATRDDRGVVPRLVPPGEERLHVSTYEDTESTSMTLEEAERYIYGDVVHQQKPQVQPPSQQAAHEKFFAGDPAFTKTMENKTLLNADLKQLRAEHHERVNFSNVSVIAHRRPVESQRSGT